MRHVAREDEEVELVEPGADVDSPVLPFADRVVDALLAVEEPERKHLVDPAVVCEEVAAASGCRAVDLAVRVREERGDGRVVSGDLRRPWIAEVAEVEPVRVEVRIDALLREERAGRERRGEKDAVFHRLPSFFGSYATSPMENGQRRATLPTDSFSSFSSIAPTK